MSETCPHRLWTKNALSPALAPAPSSRNYARAALEEDGRGRRQADADQKQLWQSVSMLLSLSAVGTQAGVIRNNGFAVPALLHDSAPG